MLLRVFRGTGPGVILLILLTAIGVWTSAFINHHHPISFHYDLYPMPLYALLKGIIGESSTTGVLFSFILMVVISFLLVNFNTADFFINERTFLPAVIYILLSGLFPCYQVLNPVLPASLFLILAIRRIMEAYGKNMTAYDFYDASVFIGAGSLFYANLIWFALLALIGIAILRTGNIKELILSVLGLCTPVFLIVGIYYVIGKDLNQLVLTTRFNLFDKSADYNFSRITITGLVIIGAGILISIFHLFSVINIKKIKSRKTFAELTWTFFLTVVVFFALPSASVELIYIAALPLSYFLTHYLIFSKKKLIPEIFFTALFLIIIVFQILYIKLGQAI
jgi:hypothetical protein